MPSHGAVIGSGRHQAAQAPCRISTAATMISEASTTAAKNSAFSCPYGWLASAGRAARRKASSATTEAATLVTVSTASEYRAALSVSQ